MESEQSHHRRGSCGQITVRQRPTVGLRSVAVLFVGPDRTLITRVDKNAPRSIIPISIKHIIQITKVTIQLMCFYMFRVIVLTFSDTFDHESRFLYFFLNVRSFAVH